MKKAIRLLACVAVFVCVLSEGKAQTYGGARLEYHKRLDKPTLTFIDPQAGTQSVGTFRQEKMNVGVFEYTTTRLKKNFTFQQELGYTLHISTFDYDGGDKRSFNQRMFDFRMLLGKVTNRNILGVQAGPAMTILIHGSTGGYEEVKSTKTFWFGYAAGVHLRINKAMFTCRYNYYFTKGDTKYVKYGTDSFYQLVNRRSYLALGMAIVLTGEGHN
ncbi:MAG: hypothetical protein ACRC3B_16595 [Bacteroidia bacterium]